MSRLLVLLSLLIAAPRVAHADGVGENVKSIGGAMAYLVPVGCSTFSTAVAGAYLTVDEGLPARWRTAGYACGAVSIGVGVYLVVDDGYSNPTKGVITTIPLVVGVAAIVTALWVGPPRDLVGDSAQLTPWFTRGGGGLVWSRSF